MVVGGSGAVSRHAGGHEGAWGREVAQGGLVGQAVCEVVKVDRGQKVVRETAIPGVVLYGVGVQLGLLGEAEAWVRGVPGGGHEGG
jgi:hypothetical protein